MLCLLPFNRAPVERLLLNERRNVISFKLKMPSNLRHKLIAALTSRWRCVARAFHHSKKWKSETKVQRLLTVLINETSSQTSKVFVRSQIISIALCSVITGRSLINRFACRTLRKERRKKKSWKKKHTENISHNQQNKHFISLTISHHVTTITSHSCSFRN